jgi:predicted nuclease of restriction endonuclease-like (RecB) superfamily
VRAISQINAQMVARVATVANQALVLRNWMVGAYIVEFEQQGADRAKYGARLLENLAEDLAAKEIKGLGAIVLGRCRQLFLTYPQLGRQIPSPPGTEFPAPLLIPSPVEMESALPGIPLPISQPLAGKLAVREATTDGKPIGDKKHQTSDAAPSPLLPEQLARISWTHFLELIRIEDPWKRAFYENELLHGNWSKRQLQRQIGSLLYERTGLSSNKKAVTQRARTQEPPQSIADVLRDPYILEFTGLAERPEYSELDLETVLLDHLQKFLLELGRGFCFESRQFRITEGRRHHRVDLVFYHRLLRCHVVIDLKIRPFQPADAGQMNFYVNWFKAHMMEKGDQPPVGILLCSDRDGTEVEFATAGMDHKLFVSRYLVALPSAEKLRTFLEADREHIESLMPPPANRKRAARKPAT